MQKNFDEFFSTPGFPKFNAMMLLHGEENLEIYKSMNPGDTYLVEAKIADVVDKGKFALILLEKIVKNATTNEIFAKITSSLIIRG